MEHVSIWWRHHESLVFGAHLFQWVSRNYNNETKQDKTLMGNCKLWPSEPKTCRPKKQASFWANTFQMHLIMLNKNCGKSCIFSGSWCSQLTHWSRDKMDAISQTTLSSAFSWMKMFEFRLQFHWSLFLMVQLTIFQHWFTSWLGAVQATSHYMNQWWLVYRRIYASLGLNELTEWNQMRGYCLLLPRHQSRFCCIMSSSYQLSLLWIHPRM